MNEEAAKQIGKMPGHYLTIEVPKLRDNDTSIEEKVAQRFSVEFANFLQQLGITEDKKALVVGLGNWNVTPDALGPMVVENLLVTRHLYKLAPETVGEGYRDVSALSPGVLGITGIETSEIVFGVVEKSKPDFVICIDALASRALHRVNTTIQISDTGIHPGSGVGNKRKAIDQSTLGIPVIAIGVPTVEWQGDGANRIERLFPDPEVAGYMKSLLLGLGQEVTPELSDMYSFLGLSHILAISGLHVTLVSSMFMWTLERTGIRRKTALITTICIDIYIGGAEHAVLHLLYSRFWHKFLYDIGVVPTKEPFQKLFNQGMILGENNEKMSKSKGNVVNPDDIVSLPIWKTLLPAFVPLG